MSSLQRRCQRDWLLDSGYGFRQGASHYSFGDRKAAFGNLAAVPSAGRGSRCALIGHQRADGRTLRVGRPPILMSRALPQTVYVIDGGERSSGGKIIRLASVTLSVRSTCDASWAPPLT